MPIHRKPDRAELLHRRRDLHESVEQGGIPWAEGIKAMRAAMGMTQADFAKTFRLTVRQLIDLEAGRANPTTETLRRLGKSFGYEVGFIRRRSPDERTAGQPERPGSRSADPRNNS